MSITCPHCQATSEAGHIVRHGSFYRTSDSRVVARFRCSSCHKTFSRATIDPCFRQKKRHKNHWVNDLIASGITQRRIARLHHLTRKTVARKVRFLGALSNEKLNVLNLKHPLATEVEFDELETFEETKCKPLSVIMAVESKTRRILGFEVASMPAKGRLAKKSLLKYGPRLDLRSEARRKLFATIKPLIADNATIRSDSNPHYLADVKEFFPNCTHIRVPGGRGSSTGQGELKKLRFDPIFTLNHTFAMFRANIATLIRKTWTTTKKSVCLADRIAIYARYHNTQLI